MFASLAKPDDDAELHWLKVRSFSYLHTLRLLLASPCFFWFQFMDGGDWRRLVPGSSSAFHDHSIKGVTTNHSQAGYWGSCTLVVFFITPFTALF